MISSLKIYLVSAIASLIITNQMMVTPPVDSLSYFWNSLTVEQQDECPVEIKADVADMTVAEYKFISAVVEAESDRKTNAESMENRTMIAVVILNRVESKSFPNTITKVLKQKGQFAVVSSGAYKRVGRTKRSDRAVIEAVRRKRTNEAPNVLYFRAGHFFKNHKRYKKIGDNYFSY